VTNNPDAFGPCDLVAGELVLELEDVRVGEAEPTVEDLLSSMLFRV
jgi:hypothetical protein